MIRLDAFGNFDPTDEEVDAMWMDDAAEPAPDFGFHVEWYPELEEDT